MCIYIENNSTAECNHAECQIVSTIKTLNKKLFTEKTFFDHQNQPN